MGLVLIFLKRLMNMLSLTRQCDFIMEIYDIARSSKHLVISACTASSTCSLGRFKRPSLCCCGSCSSWMFWDVAALESTRIAFVGYLFCMIQSGLCALSPCMKLNLLGANLIYRDHI